MLPQLIRYGLIPSLVTSVLLGDGCFIYTGIVPMAPSIGGDARQLGFRAGGSADDGVLRLRYAVCIVW